MLPSIPTSTEHTPWPYPTQWEPYNRLELRIGSLQAGHFQCCWRSSSPPFKSSSRSSGSPLTCTALTKCNHANTISKARGNRHLFFFRVWDAVYSKIFHCQCVVLSEKRGVYSKLATNHQISVCPIFRQSNRSFQLDTIDTIFFVACEAP